MLGIHLIQVLRNHALVLIFCIGFILRIYVSASSPFFISEQGRDILVAKHLSTTWSINTTIHQNSSVSFMPYSTTYYNFLSFLYRLFPDIVAIRYVFDFLSSFIVFIFYGIGRRYCGDRCGKYLAIIAASSFIIVNYGADITGHAFAPLFVGSTLLCIVSVSRYQSDGKNIFFLLVSEAALFIGILFTTSLLTIYPLCLALWVGIIIVTIHGSFKKVFLTLLTLLHPFALLLLHGVMPVQMMGLVSQIQNSTSDVPRLGLYRDNLALFLSTVQPPLLMYVGILGAAACLAIYPKRCVKPQWLVLMLLMVATGILSTTYSPSGLELHYHYLSALYVPYILLFSLLLFVADVPSVRMFASIIIVLFVSSSVFLLVRNHSEDFSIHDRKKLVAVISRSAYVQRQQPFRIVTAFTDQIGLNPLSDWLAPNFWYALETELGRDFVQVVPIEISNTNIYVPDSGDRYLLICFEYEKYYFYRLDKCLRNWEKEYNLPIRPLGTVTESSVAYSIYETLTP
jgi:hypothetical protein